MSGAFSLPAVILRMLFFLVLTVLPHYWNDGCLEHTKEQWGTNILTTISTNTRFGSTVAHPKPEDFSSIDLLSRLFKSSRLHTEALWAERRRRGTTMISYLSEVDTPFKNI
jgi:hypothetical protein